MLRVCGAYLIGFAGSDCFFTVLDRVIMKTNREWDWKVCRNKLHMESVESTKVLRTSFEWSPSADPWHVKSMSFVQMLKGHRLFPFAWVVFCVWSGVCKCKQR